MTAGPYARPEPCPGTVVRHGAGDECTDPDCRAPFLDRHELVVACTVLPACGCATPSGGRESTPSD